MFAALMVVRLREACLEASAPAADAATGEPGAEAVCSPSRTSPRTRGWQSPDSVAAINLPLARATEKVLSSMQTVLEKTMEAKTAASAAAATSNAVIDSADVSDSNRQHEIHLRETKAAEIKVVRHVQDLVSPDQRYRAVEMSF
jgi:pyridoxine kinase